MQSELKQKQHAQEREAAREVLLRHGLIAEYKAELAHILRRDAKCRVFDLPPLDLRDETLPRVRHD